MLRRTLSRIPSLINQMRFHCSSTKIQTTNHDHSVSYSITDLVPGTYQGNSGIYMLMLTCGPCGNKMARTFTKDAYHKGVVLIRCDSCDNIHLIADNLGWFEDKTWNVETHSQEQGKVLPKLKHDEVSALVSQFINKNK